MAQNDTPITMAAKMVAAICLKFIGVNSSVRSNLNPLGDAGVTSNLCAALGFKSALFEQNEVEEGQAEGHRDCPNRRIEAVVGRLSTHRATVCRV